MECVAMPSEKTMKELCAAAAKLNSKTDELNEVIGEFEEDLEKAGVGVTEWLTLLLDETDSKFDPHDETFSKSGWELGYAKVEGKWRLAVRQVFLKSRLGRFDDDITSRHSDKTLALTNAPRVVRMQAAELFENLATAITLRMNEYVAAIEEAKRAARGKK